MRATKRPAVLWIAVVLGTGVLAVSTAAIFIRLGFEAAGGGSIGLSMVLAAVRMVAAAVLIAPAWRGLRGGGMNRAAGWLAIAAGLCLAAHFALWISSFAYTTIAASTTLVTTNPIWVALAAWWWFGERPSRLTAAGIGIAVAGGALIAWADAGGQAPGPSPLIGDGLALAGSWAFSGYLLLSREAQRRGLGMWPSVAVIYTAAAVALAPLPPALGVSYLGWPAVVYGCAVGMAIVPQMLGHSAINWSVRWVSPTIVALAILTEPLGATALGYVVFAEAPGWMVLLGAAVLLSGLAAAIWGARARPGRAAPPAEPPG